MALTHIDHLQVSSDPPPTAGSGEATEEVVEEFSPFSGNGSDVPQSQEYVERTFSTFTTSVSPSSGVPASIVLVNTSKSNTYESNTYESNMSKSGICQSLFIMITKVSR